MFNFTLYKRELKGSLKMLLIFIAILSLYIPMIISMFDPKMEDILNQFTQAMPDLVAAVGMSGTSSTLLGFMSTYLYGMILLIFPMVYSIIRANGLIAKYVDRGSMVSLVGSPVKRTTVAFTQMTALVTGIFIIIGFSTVLEIAVAQAFFPGELDISNLLFLNLGLFGLQLFIGAFCFLCSCIFNDTKFSIGFGAGITSLMYVLQMLSNIGGAADYIKYTTFFTLFNPNGLVNSEKSAIIGIVILFLSTILLFGSAIIVFKKKDLHI